jgi:hypothetical protein
MQGGGRGRPFGTISPQWKTWLDAVKQIIDTYDVPLTVRQIYYQLIAHYGMKKTNGMYNSLCKHLVQERQKRNIDWTKIVDLTRKPIRQEWIAEDQTPEESFEEDFKKFLKTVRCYIVPQYTNQEYLIEVWVEHEGLMPLFERAIGDFGITIYPTKGRNSWSNAYAAYERLKDVDREIVILHFSDADVYGENMTKNIQEAFDYFYQDRGMKHRPKVEKVALTLQQVQDWNLPDTQLEAIDPSKFIQLITMSVLQYIDLDKKEERDRLMEEGRKRVEEMLRERGFIDDTQS